MGIYLSRSASQPAAAPQLASTGGEAVPVKPASAAIGRVAADRQKVAVPEYPPRDVQKAKNDSLRIRCSRSLHVSATISWWQIKCRILNH